MSSLWVKMVDEGERSEFFMWRKQRNHKSWDQMVLPAVTTRLAHEEDTLEPWPEPDNLEPLQLVPQPKSGSIRHNVSTGPIRNLITNPGAVGAPPWI